MTSLLAAKELLIRRRARGNIYDFVNAIDVPGRPPFDNDDFFFQPHTETIARHHRLILDALVDITTRPYGRLMILMPPGSAKSTYASVVFPAYYLGMYPEKKIILASYGDDLVRKLGRRTRSIIRQGRYQNIFSTALREDSQAAQEFALTNGSEYLAGGILTGITGNRAHGVIIDDPIKGREQADSPTVRQKVFDAYEDDLKTRLIPGGWVVIIQTRWHEDDLAGRILPADWRGESGLFKCRDGNDWSILSIQAECQVDYDPLGRKKGEFLWPEWFDAKHWDQYRSNQRTWSALYQQVPTPETGTLFQVGKLETIDAVPVGTKSVRGWDLAATAAAGDWTCGIRLGIMPDGRYIIEDLVRIQEGPHEVEATIKATASRDGKAVRIGLPQDPGQAGKAQIAYLVRGLRGYPVVAKVNSGSKILRAEPFASQLNVGNVVLLRANWNRLLMEELAKFPNGAHDDIVDSISTAFDLISEPTTAGLFDYYRSANESPKDAN